MFHRKDLPCWWFQFGFWGSYRTRKIDDISDRIGAEQAGRFLYFLQVFGRHAQGK